MADKDETKTVTLVGGGPLDGHTMEVPVDWKMFRPKGYTSPRGIYQQEKPGSLRWKWLGEGSAEAGGKGK